MEMAMNRWLMVAVIGLMVGGCAEGVSDPMPETSEPAATEKAPEQMLFAAKLDMITHHQELGLSATAPVSPELPNEALPEIPTPDMPSPR